MCEMHVDWMPITTRTTLSTNALLTHQLTNSVQPSLTPLHSRPHPTPPNSTIHFTSLSLCFLFHSSPCRTRLFSLLTLCFFSSALATHSLYLSLYHFALHSHSHFSRSFSHTHHPAGPQDNDSLLSTTATTTTVLTTNQDNILLRNFHNKPAKEPAFIGKTTSSPLPPLIHPVPSSGPFHPLPPIFTPS